VVLEVVPSLLDQLDMKDFPPSRGRNPSFNGRFCHQKAESFLIKIGKGRIWDLTGDIPFLYLVQRPSKGEILVKTTQHKSATKCIIADKRPWPLPGVGISCSSMFLLLMIKSWIWEWRCILLSSFIRSKDWEHSALQHKKNKLALSEEQDAKSEFCALSETGPDPVLLYPRLNFKLYRGKMIESWKALMPRNRQRIASPTWQG